MKDRELTVFKVEFGGTTWAEWRIRPNIGTAAKMAVLGLGALGIAWGGKEAVAWADDLLRPKYIVNGSYNSPIPDEPTPWVRPTDWSRKVK